MMLRLIVAGEKIEIEDWKRSVVKDAGAWSENYYG